MASLFERVTQRNLLRNIICRGCIDASKKVCANCSAEESTAHIVMFLAGGTLISIRDPHFATDTIPILLHKVKERGRLKQLLLM